MIKVFSKELGAVLDWKQKAISVASHNGDTEHVTAAQSILPESEWGLMQTPLDVPLMQFGRQVLRPRRWFHCCSGEHAAILMGCKLKGWNRAGYTLPQHEFFLQSIPSVKMLFPENKSLMVCQEILRPCRYPIPFHLSQKKISLQRKENATHGVHKNYPCLFERSHLFFHSTRCKTDIIDRAVFVEARTTPENIFE